MKLIWLSSVAISSVAALALCSSSTAIIAPPAGSLTLQEGTAVPLKFSRAITSSDVIAGETVDLYAVADVKVGGTIVIPRYSPARATVMLARARQKVGLGGRLQLRFDSVRLADGEDAPLRLMQSVEVGISKGVIIGLEASLLTDAFPATLILRNKTGKDVEIARDEEVTAYVDRSTDLDAAKFANVAALPAPSGMTVTPVRGRDETQAQVEKLACGSDSIYFEVHRIKEATPPPVAIPDGMALFYVVRPSFVAPGEQTPLSVDNIFRGVNLHKAYFYFTLAPGSHYFCSHFDNNLHALMSMVVEPGRTYYLQQKFPYGGMQIEVLNETEGKATLAKCNRTRFAVSDHPPD